MGLLGNKAEIFDERSRNGNVRDIESDHKHAAHQGPHQAAVNDLRPTGDYQGRHHRPE